MDRRSSYYHSTRYASSHPPPPPPQDNPNFYNLPPPPSYPPPPSQARFNPQVPVHQIVVSNPNHHPVRGDYYLRSQPEYPGFLPVRLPEFDYRVLPRVLDDGRGRGGEYPAADYKQELFRQEVRSVNPVRIRSELVVNANARFSGDVNERSEYSTRERGFLGHDTVGYHRGRDRDQDPSSRDYRDYPHHDSSSRGFDLISDYGREVRRDVLKSMVGTGNKEFRDYDQYRIGYNSREGTAGLERHKDTGSRETSKGSRDSYEFNRTPPKKKKSAFLRIQQPIVKNKEDQLMHYSGYYDAEDKLSGRGKDQNSYSGRGTEDKAGRGVPVELDVSFKSNSLVAKAVVTSPSASVSSSIAGFNPRNSKVRKLDISEKGILSPPPMKPKRLATRLNSVVVKNVSSYGTDQEESKEKVTASTAFRNLDFAPMPQEESKEKVTASTAFRNLDFAPMPQEESKEKVTASTAFRNLDFAPMPGIGVTSTETSDEGGCCLISGKKTLPKVAKKKKPIKIVVKKSENARAGVSSLQPVKLPNKPPKDDGQLVASGSDTSSISASVKAKGSDGLSNDGTIIPDHCLPLSSKCGNYVNPGSLKIGVSQLNSNDSSVIPKNDKLGMFEKDMLSDELNSEENSVHDASVGMQVSLKDLSVMPENDKIEKSEDDLISEEPYADENFGSKLILDDRPVIPEYYKLATLEQAMLSDKPNSDATSVHDASDGTSGGDSQLCLETDQLVSNEHFVPDAANKSCDSRLCPEKSKLETVQKALMSEKPISGVRSADDGHANLSQHDVSSLLGKDVHRASPQVSPSDELAHFDSSNVEKNEILTDPINSCNSNLRIDGYETYGQESCHGSDITVKHSCKRRFSELKRASQENGQNQCSNVNSIARRCNELFSSLNSDNKGAEIATAATSAACYNSGKETVVCSGNSCSNHGTGGDIFKKSSPSEGVNTPKGEDGSRNSVKDLSLSMSEVTDMEHVNRLNSAAWVDTTLRLSFKDSMMDPKEASYVGLRSGTAGTDAVQLVNLAAVSEANTLVTSNDMVELDQTSPEKKKRKLSPFEHDLSSSTASLGKDQDTSASIPVTRTGVLSTSCNDPTKLENAASSFMGQLCMLKGLGSHNDDNEADMSMDVSASAMEIVTCSECGPNLSNMDIKVSSITAQCPTDILPENSRSVMLVDSHSVRGCFDSKSSSGNEHQIGMAEAAVHETLNILSGGEANATINMSQGCSGNDSMDLEIRNGREMEMEALEDQILTNDESAQSCLPSETLAAPDMRTDAYLVKRNLPSATLVMSKGRSGTGLMDSEPSNGHEMEIEAAEDRVANDNEGVQNRLPSEFQPPVSTETLSVPDTEIFMSYPEGKNLPSMSNHLSLSEALNDQLSKILPEAVPVTSYPQKLPDVAKTLLSQNLTEKSSGSVELPSVNSITREAPHNLCSQNNTSVVSSNQAVAGGRSILGRPPILKPKDSLDIIQKLNGPSRESYDKKNQSSHMLTKIQPHQPSFGLTAPKNVPHLAQSTKRRTWHRNDTSTGPVLPKNVAGSQSMSYVRKGNSLVRKPSPVAARPGGSLDSSTLQSRLNSSSLNAVGDNTVSDRRVDVHDAANIARAERRNSSIERPRTPPLPIVPKVPHRTTNPLVDRAVSPAVESLNVSAGTLSDPLVCVETKDIPRSSDSQLRNSEAPATWMTQVKNLATPNEASEGRVESSGVNITYVKRKSNQLVATSSLSSVSTHGPFNNQPLSSKSYYKRSKNQLVRTTLDGCIKPGCGNSDDSSKAEGHSTQGMQTSGNLGRRQLLQGVRKIRKPKKHSLVWTLSGAQTSNDVGQSLHRQRIIPNLFPWKRATYRRTALPSSFSSSIISSIASKKFLPLRTHDTVYTRSKHGFSLVKSKVVSVGGSSLKWSKSIQSRSKKVNEEATLAVAAADKKKREQNGARRPVSGTKNKNSPAKERIFRIGLVRYKMDPSGRTLHRISDEALPSADIPQTEKDTKKPYVPRRLTIGKDEYVRIGTGNKLIRNPKKRSRILASEKVRWSLHTARSRLAKKRKYCQFFTRFGKCNKDDGKCRYIHDSSKIAVCTKFLHGLCSNDDCKLTHKVIPERMPDCSFYLQGLCTNKHCSYRHVHVNPKAPTCEGFLKGYCAEGNECRKKHSYVCPTYEATGSCPQGPTCKLQHPKNRSKGKKRKRLLEKNQHHGQGRYFSGMHFSPEHGTAVPAERSTQMKNVDRAFSGNEGDDFISLGISDEEDAARGEESGKDRVVDEQLDWSDSESLDDSELSNLDKLIMPVRIMNI